MSFYKSHWEAVLCQQLPSVEKSHCTVHKSKKIEWGMMYKLYALILLAYSYWWNISYYEKSEIKDLQFYIDIIFRIELHWRLCHCQLIQLCFSKFTYTVCLLKCVCLLCPPTNMNVHHWYTATHIHFYTMTNCVFNPFGQVHNVYNSLKTNSDDTLSRSHVWWYHRQIFHLWIILTCVTN